MAPFTRWSSPSLFLYVFGAILLLFTYVSYPNISFHFSTYWQNTIECINFQRHIEKKKKMPNMPPVRSRGRKGGRPKAMDQKTFEKALKLYNQGEIPVDVFCKRLKIKRRTFYRYLNDYKIETRKQYQESRKKISEPEKPKKPRQ